MQMPMEVHGILLEGLRFIMQVMLLKILKNLAKYICDRFIICKRDKNFKNRGGVKCQDFTVIYKTNYAICIS